MFYQTEWFKLKGIPPINYLIQCLKFFRKFNSFWSNLISFWNFYHNAKWIIKIILKLINFFWHNSLWLYYTAMIWSMKIFLGQKRQCSLNFALTFLNEPEIPSNFWNHMGPPVYLFGCWRAWDFEFVNTEYCVNIFIKEKSFFVTFEYLNL